MWLILILIIIIKIALWPLLVCKQMDMLPHGQAMPAVSRTLWSEEKWIGLKLF